MSVGTGVLLHLSCTPVNRIPLLLRSCKQDFAVEPEVAGFLQLPSLRTLAVADPGDAYVVEAESAQSGAPDDAADSGNRGAARGYRGHGLLHTDHHAKPGSGAADHRVRPFH